MKTCPYCQIDLSDLEDLSETCPFCGGDLAGKEAEVQPHLRSIVDLTGKESSEELPVASGEPAAAEETPAPADDLTRTIGFAEATHDELSFFEVDEPAEPAAPRPLTESDYTIAFVDPPVAEGAAQPPAPEADDPTRTIGFAEQTHADDLSFVVEPTAGRPLTESDYTVAFVDQPPPPAPDDPRATRGIGATMDAGELPPEQVEMLTGMWGGTIPPKARPGMTIKAAAAGEASKTHLVVRPRSVRHPDQLSLEGADYELLETIGQGGMGVVYSARQASIDRTVAIKMIRRDMATDAEQRHKFLSEAVVTGDLDHPNIVPIYDLGSNEAGALFYSMKRVEGTPWMKVIGQKGLDENLEIFMKVADAVAFAHSRGVIHRDLKPENVMLGDFGEVLVMDWGLALLAPRFRHLGTITQSGGMGGTPAYMAPEMASGPLERIGTASDVYLLGAILYEVITGKPPHAGKDVMSCLYAVARNEIQPTEKSGELLDIALRAMATEIQNRYETVQDLQAAVREYYSHSESSLLSDRADEDLRLAGQTGDYQDHARAVFGYQEALSLWNGNERAHAGLLVAKSAYAERAATNGDLDLAASLLDADEPSFATLRQKIIKGQRERNAQKRRLKLAMRSAQALVATVVVVVTVAFFWIRAQRDRAVVAEIQANEQRQQADDQRDRAVVAEKQATEQRDRAVVAEEQATEQRNRALAAEADAERKRDAALEAERIAAEQRNIAIAAEEQAREDRDKAVAAERAEAKLREQEEELRQQKEYEAYIAQIGLVAAKIDENAFGYAADLLDDCPDPLRNWEWGRLMHLCRQSVQSFREGGPIDAACYSPDGSRIVTGSWDGRARVWDVATGRPLFEMPHGMYVHAVAYSPDGRLIATGSNDETGELRLWDAENGAPLRTIGDHTDAVLSVAFSRDGKRLLSGSYDNTARLWDVESGASIREFKGHTWWVWAAQFSPDEKKVVTASQDGTAIVWSVDSAEHSAPFTGHNGPVYCAAFSPDGEHVATAGYDKRILIWRPQDVRPFDFAVLATGQQSAATNYLPLAGHTAPVRAVHFSNDGRTLLSGGHDNTVKLWDLSRAACSQTLRGHAGWVRSCVFAPGERMVLSAGYDHEAKVWDIERYEEIRTFNGHDDALLSAAFSPDGQHIVTAARDRTAKIWDVTDRSAQATLSEGHSFLVSSLAFTPEGDRLVTGAGDNTVRVWDTASGGEVASIEHTGRGGVFALSRDGKQLLTGSDSASARLWDLASGKTIIELPGHKSDITALAISPDGSLLFTGDLKGRGRVWNASTGALEYLFEGHSRKITAAHFLPDNRRLLTASGDNTVGQWDIATGRELTDSVLKHPSGVTALAVSHDGRLAVTACEDQHLRVWQLEPVRLLRDFATGKYEMSSVDLAPDGLRALTACSDRKVRLWDLNTGVEVRGAKPAGAQDALIDTGRNAVWSAVFSPDGQTIATAGGNDARMWRIDSGREITTFSPHGAVAAASFSPDGKRVATCSWDGTIKVWDATAGTVDLKFIASRDKYVNQVCFSPDGTKLLSASDDHTAKIWDAATGKLLVSLPAEGAEGHQGLVRSARFSADGKRVVTGSTDKTARLWDAESGQPVATFRGHDWAVLSVAISDDGKFVLTGSEDDSARVWNASTGEQLLLLAGHTAAVTSVAFSPDGTRAVTGGQDNAVKLWDPATGKEVLHLKHHTQEISSVAFSPDGRALLTSSRDGTAVLWPSVEWK